MAVTVTYTLNFVRNLDLTEGPATANPDATSLAGGGFAVAGDFESNTAVEIFDAGANSIAGTATISGQKPAIDQLTNGNIVIASRDADSARFTIKTAAGGNVTSVDLLFDNQNLDVTALRNGGFWIVGDTHSGLKGDIDVYVRNSNGSAARIFAIDLTSADDVRASVAGLDNGNVAVAWTRAGDVTNPSKVWYAVYTPAGDVIRAPANFLTADHAEDPSVTASAEGFAIAFGETGWGTGASDITLARFTFDGAFLDGGNISNPQLAADGTHEFAPSTARLPNDMLAIAYTVAPVSSTDMDTAVALVDPATSTVLAVKTISSGEGLTGVVSAPTVTGFGNGGIAVFHNHETDLQIDGELLQAQRTATGDAAANIINGDNLLDTLSGLGGNDVLRGFGGNDRLIGGRGDDALNGGAGRDIMTGGPGFDRYIFSRVTDSGLTAATRDRITDFRHLTDKIDLTAIDAKENTAGNNTFTFRGTLPFTREGQIRVVQSGSTTIVELNTKGVTGAEMTIQLDNVTASALTVADFFF
jgi:RTX calcium-binding nonapeptide repeat (4 copies)